MKNISVVIITLILAVSGITAEARGGRSGGGSRPNYGGGKHSSSHDGHYQGGSGSSHKGGTYKNSKTNDQYGTHKD
jgi:hypothetical protein